MNVWRKWRLVDVDRNRWRPLSESIAIIFIAWTHHNRFQSLEMEFSPRRENRPPRAEPLFFLTILCFCDDGSRREKRIVKIKKEIAEPRAGTTTLETQLAKLQAGESLDLLAMVDLGQDAVAGNWQWKDKRLLSPGTPDARLAFPVRPSGDDHFTAEFKRPGPRRLPLEIWHLEPLAMSISGFAVWCSRLESFLDRAVAA